MTLSVDTLAAGLENVSPQETESAGVEAFADAWTDYFYEAELQIAPAPPAWQVEDDSLTSARAAMVEAMSGLANVDGYGAIQAGIVAFWGVVSASAATVWVAIPPIAAAVPPAGITGIAAALAPVGVTNIEGMVDLPTASRNIATALNTANQGGTATDTTTPTPLTWVIV